MLKYVHENQAGIINAINALNGNDALPLKGMRGGVLEETPSTFNWCEVGSERQLLDGRWCIDKIPNASLDYMKIEQAACQAFLTGYGITIENIEETDMVPLPEPKIDEVLDEDKN